MKEFVLDNILLIALAAASGAGMLWTFIRPSGAARLDAHGVVRLANGGALVLDVRSREEFAKGHVVHARNIPADEVAARVGELAKHKEKPVVAVCQNGQRAPRIAGELKKHGFVQIYALSGGILAWREANLPLVKR